MIDINFNSAKIITQKIVELQRPNRDRATFLVADDLTFGLERMYESVAAPFSRKHWSSLICSKRWNFLMLVRTLTLPGNKG
jgi:hypothetical protein